MREDYPQTLSENAVNEYRKDLIENNESDGITFIITFGIVIFICLFPAAMFQSGNLSRR